MSRILSALLAILLSATVAWAQSTEPPSGTPGALNPAVTQANINSTICKSGWTAKVRPAVSYTNKLKKQLMADTKLPWSQAKKYELDHRVPLEVGGNPTDPHNLWIEPWDGALGAHSKDKLENAVKRDVCSHKLTLEQGRAIFLGDWQVEFKKRYGG